MQRRGFDTLPWNAVAIAEEGRSAPAIALLAAVGEFRSTPYRGVLVGTLRGGSADAVVDTYERNPAAFADVTRLIPLEKIVPFQGDDVTESLCCALDGCGGRVAGQSFHVRARLRGLKGRVESQAVERALGGFLLDLAAKTEERTCVTFDDPDLILAVEVIGARVGYGFLDRGLRAIPLVRPR